MIYIEVGPMALGICNYPPFLTGYFELLQELLGGKKLANEKFPIFFGNFYEGEVKPLQRNEFIIELKELKKELLDISIDFKKIYKNENFKSVPDLDNQLNKEAKSFGEVFLDCYNKTEIIDYLLMNIEGSIKFEWGIEIINRIGPNGL